MKLVAFVGVGYATAFWIRLSIISETPHSWRKIRPWQAQRVDIAVRRKSRLTVAWMFPSSMLFTVSVSEAVVPLFMICLHATRRPYFRHQVVQSTLLVQARAQSGISFSTPKTFFVLTCGYLSLHTNANRPIEVNQSDSPDDAYVNSLHEELIRRVEKIYRDHRPEWEKRELVIL